MAHHQSLKRHTSQCFGLISAISAIILFLAWFAYLLSSRTLHRNSSVCSKGFCKCGKYTTSVNSLNFCSAQRFVNLESAKQISRQIQFGNLGICHDPMISHVPSHVAHDHHICLSRSKGGFGELQVNPVQDLPIKPSFDAALLRSFSNQI